MSKKRTTLTLDAQKGELLAETPGRRYRLRIGQRLEAKVGGAVVRIVRMDPEGLGGEGSIELQDEGGRRIVRASRFKSVISTYRIDFEVVPRAADEEAEESTEEPLAREIRAVRARLSNVLEAAAETTDRVDRIERILEALYLEMAGRPYRDPTAPEGALTSPDEGLAPGTMKRLAIARRAT